MIAIFFYFSLSEYSDTCPSLKTILFPAGLRNGWLVSVFVLCPLPVSACCVFNSSRKTSKSSSCHHPCIPSGSPPLHVSLPCGESRAASTVSQRAETDFKVCLFRGKLGQEWPAGRACIWEPDPSEWRTLLSFFSASDWFMVVMLWAALTKPPTLKQIQLISEWKDGDGEIRLHESEGRGVSLLAYRFTHERIISQFVAKHSSSVFPLSIIKWDQCAEEQWALKATRCGSALWHHFHLVVMVFKSILGILI